MAIDNEYSIGKRTKIIRPIDDGSPESFYSQSFQLWSWLYFSHRRNKDGKDMCLLCYSLYLMPPPNVTWLNVIHNKHNI